MASGSRMPSWKERENNKKRERRRRALAAKIFAGLRTYGNYKLPKHCDNNEVLKALCNEAGWTVEPDGTTYRQGCKPPPPDRMDITNVGGSASASPCSSYHPSPCASYNPSPTSSSFPSPSSSTHSYAAANPNGTSLIPWLKNLSSSSSSSSKYPNLYIHGGSISAPVTPPLSSPRTDTNWDNGYHFHNSVLFPSSTPPSPAAGRQGTAPGLDWPPNSPTFSFVSFNPFGFKDSRTMTNGESGESGGSRMWTPGQSGTCSPVIPVGAAVNNGDVSVTVRDAVMSDEFAFGCNTGSTSAGLVKPWEGERIHEEFGSDDLELTLGCSKTRLD